jgi:hypothetical protein
MRSLRFTALLFLALTGSIAAAELKPATVQAWNQYVRWADEKVQRELSNPNGFLIQNGLPAAERVALQQQIQSGGIFVRRMSGVIPPGTHFQVSDGEIHHWWGTILLRNISLSRLLQFLQDYNHHAGKFSDVERSRLISVEGNRYRVYFRFRRTKAIVTVVYNTEQDCRYDFYSPSRASSSSIATQIAEVDSPGTASEREKIPGNDSGFLWRLVSWWRYEQQGNDVVVELESASLSRDIPLLIKWMPGVSSYIRSTPKESLESVLNSIREHAK